MEKDIDAIACDDARNKGRLWDREFANDAMKDKVSVVSIKAQGGIKKRKGVKIEAVVGGIGNVNVRRKRTENDPVDIKDQDKNEDDSVIGKKLQVLRGCQCHSQRRQKCGHRDN